MKNRDTRRSVLITGATSGIGSAIALEFAHGGWDIMAHYHSSDEKAAGLKKKIEKTGVNCSLFKADLSSKKELEHFAKECEGMTVDSLVNNAGTYIVAKHFSELTIDEMQDTFMVNTFAPFFMSSKVFTGMKKRGFGRIVNISSIAAKYGGSDRSMHYGSSKRALEGITKTLARCGAGCNILVNTVRPGVIDTDFHKKFPKDMTKRIEMIPMRRIGKPEDVASLVYYLGSEKNTFVTSEVIAVSGGE